MERRKRSTKHAAVVALVAVLALSAIVGCTQSGGNASSPESSGQASSQQASSQSVGIANPWSDAANAEDAARGAGLDGFDVMDSIQIGEAEFGAPAFSYMEGIAQAAYESPAAEVTLRKSNAYSGKEELAGDYNDYAQSWTQNHKGLEITCYGDDDNAAQLILWQFAGNSYSLAIRGLGGEALGMTPDDITSLVSGIQ